MNDIARASRKRPRARAGPTIADVAHVAGVSKMTASCVINGEPNVDEAKRARVREAVRSLGYTPNPAARNLACGQQCRIALLLNNPSASYLSEFLVGALEGFGTAGGQLVAVCCDGSEGAEELVARLKADRIDGVLLPPPLCDDGALCEALRVGGIPMAQIATGRPADFAHAVTIDDEEAARTMASHLISRRHHRIGFIAGNSNQPTNQLRRRGYELALAEADIAIVSELIVEGDSTYRSGLVAAEVLLTQKQRPTAIFASNDDMAAAALAVARRHRLDVPREISIVGYDDTPIATIVWPQLTAIRQPIRDMARTGTQLLVEAVQHELEGQALAARHVRLNFELIQRASDADRHHDAS